MGNSYIQYLDEVTAMIQSVSPIIPVQRSTFKKGYSFSKLPFEIQLPIWNSIWKTSANYRVKLQALFFLEKYINKQNYHRAIWDITMIWQDDVADWGQCDYLAKLFTKILVSFPDEVYLKLTDWNNDNDLWKRRQSVVSLLYFHHTKKTYLPFEQIARLVAALLNDKEYYVQKGVGWALREMYSVYPTETLPFLQKHIKSISAIAFTISIEKMDVVQKEELKKMRKR